MKTVVLGTGSWGTTLAKVLADNNHGVKLWGRNQATVDEINTQHTNQAYLTDVVFPEKIQATTDLKEALVDAEMIVVVIPTRGIRSVMAQVNEHIHQTEDQPIIVHATKGIESGTHARISVMIAESLDDDTYRGIAVLSGPSHAEEVAKEQLTTITVASKSQALAAQVQTAFMTPYFRLYTNTDIIGVELGGALKNIIALGAGIISGLGFGDNTKAALMTRGLAEISRLGVALGADPLTFSGLSGMGDLIVTCTSIHSRNFRAGQLFAQEKTIEEVEAEINMAVEGISTCNAVFELIQVVQVDMPITTVLYKIMYESAPVKEGIDHLMTREGKAEASLDMHIDSTKQ